MLQVVAGCVIAVALVVAGTNVAMVLMTRDGIVDTEAAAGCDADAIVVLGASVSVFVDTLSSRIENRKMLSNIKPFKRNKNA